jgi:predicted NUDIX family phosphoesterase
MSSMLIDFFYNNVIETSSDKESNNRTKLLIPATSMSHDHSLLPKRRGGSSVKRMDNKNRYRFGGHAGLMREYISSSVSDVQKVVSGYSSWREDI